MNIVVVDSDPEHNASIEKYLIYLGLQSSIHNDFDELFLWVEKENPEVDIFLIAVDDYLDKNFNHAVSLKDKPLAKMPIIIFMLKNHCDKGFIRALKYGDGYLLKPFSEDLLISAIHYHKKHAEINRLLANKNQKLVEYKTYIDREHQVVESIFSNHFEQYLVDSDSIRFYISPASVFNGDVLLTEYGPDGTIYVAVGDVTGHGLAAAIGAMPVYSTFRDMAREGASVGKIAYEMNRALRQLLPDNMMMAITITQLNYAEARAIIWSGGMPEVLLVTAEGQIRRKIMAQHAPLAVLDPEQFRQDVDIIHLDMDDRIFFYTDGIEEARNQAGDMYGIERFQSLFSGDASKIFNNIIESHAQFIGSKKQDDDITLVELCYDKQLLKRNPKIGYKEYKKSIVDWEMQFTIDAEAVKQDDPLAYIVNLISHIVGSNYYQDCIATILSELFNNALDHGLLKLESDIKNTPDGFIDYYLLRKKKIAALTEGEIGIKLSLSKSADGHQLKITVSDSGSGFNFDKVTMNLNNGISYGHGLQLVKNLCTDLSYNQSKAAITAVYPFH